MPQPPRSYGSPRFQAPSAAASKGRPTAGPATGDALKAAYHQHMANAMKAAHQQFVQGVAQRPGVGAKVSGSSAPTLRSIMPTGTRGRQINREVDKRSG